VESIDLFYSSVNEENQGNKVGLRSSWADDRGNQYDIDDVWFTYEAGEKEALDLSEILSDDEQIDALEQYFSFEQVGNDILGSVAEKGGSTEQTCDNNSATQMLKLDSGSAYSREYEDLMKLLIDNNQMVDE